MRVACQCGHLLDVSLRLGPPAAARSLDYFEQKWSRRYDPLCFSGVWRFHELLPFAPLDQVVTIGEGQTLLQESPSVGRTSAWTAGSCSCNTKG